MTGTAQPKLILCELTDPGLSGVETYSPFCLKVHRALRAAGLAYERRHAGNPADFKHLNPTGQVPVLLVDAEPISDSTLILRRIDAMTGVFSRSFDARQQAEAWLWEEFADTSLSGFLVSARWADSHNWPLTRAAFFDKAPWFVRRIVVPMVRGRIIKMLIARDVWRRGPAACWQRFETLLDQLEQRAPAQGFWIGDALSVADVALFGQLHSLRTPLTRAQAQQLAARSRLSAYLDRVDRATAIHAARADGKRPFSPGLEPINA